MGRPREDRGFTLLEIILTIVILGIVAALVYPRLAQQLGRRSLEDQALTIKSELQSMQAKALSDSHTVAVRFQRSSSPHLRLLEYKHITGDTTGHAEDYPEGTDTWHKMASKPVMEGLEIESVSANYPNGRVIFGVFGEPVAGAGEIVLRVPPGSERIAIKIAAATGYVTLESR